MPPNPDHRPDLGAAALARITREQQQRAESVQRARTGLAPYRAARPTQRPQEG